MHDLTFGSLFAGIGGIDLGLERAGWTGRWQVENDPYCVRVLEKHWPGVTRYGDIHAVDWGTVERVDLVAGGFPCQPVSAAGKQGAQADARWLWPEFARAVRALRPRLVLVENVTNLLAVNGGTAFGDVLGDLAACGYDAEWDCIPAAALGALHERDRVWIVAYPNGERLEGSEPVGQRLGKRARTRDGRPDVAHAFGGRPPGPREPVAPVHPASSEDREATQPLDGGISDQWSTEPDVGRVAHGVPARVDRLRGLGNAVVPQVAEFIGWRFREWVTG